MPRCKRFLLIPMIILCLTGCQSWGAMTNDEAGIYEKIHRYYHKMKSYSAQVTLTVKGNKTENVYEMEQYEKDGDKRLLRITSPEEIAGTETIVNGEKTLVRKGTTDANALILSSQEELDICFVSTFLRYYYGSEETAVSVASKMEENGTTLLETVLQPTSAERSRATMLLDNKTLAPKSITVYDAGGNIVLLAEIKSFVYNDTIDDKMFEMES